MDKLTFTMKGAKELEAALKDMGPKFASRSGAKALRAAAKPIVSEAKRLVPRRTGDLRKSITAVTERQKSQTQRTVLIGFKPPVSRRAHLTEFGTSHSAARPFIRPALDARASDALHAMMRTLSNELAKAGWKQPDIAPED